MRIALTTTFNKRIYDEYAYRFIDSYNWTFPVTVYSEEADLKEHVMSKITNPHLLDKVKYQFKFIHLNEASPESVEFVERNSYRKPENYRHDGVRFSYKVFSYTHFILNNSKKKDGLICIDADSVFHKPIDHTWVQEHLHRDGKMMTFLGRNDNNPLALGAKGRKSYSECGFLYFNCNHDRINDYAEEMIRMYVSDDIYKEAEQQDCWIWDGVRKRFQSEGVENYDIGDNQWGHVQARSVLANVYDHTKGNRKVTGRSPERKR
jgi:hypothetical protein